MIFPEWKRKKILPVRKAHHELENLGLLLIDVVKVLEYGYDCPRAKRKKGTIERCLRKGKKVVRVVVKEGVFTYPDGYIEDVWWLIHVSIETFKPRRLRI